jgi:hypothetical protein
MRRNVNNKESRVADMKRVANGGTRRDQRFTHGQPVLGQRAREIQPYGEMSRRLPVGLDEGVRRASVESVESNTRRHNRSAGHVQEASLAGLGPDLLQPCTCSLTNTTRSKPNLWT